MLGVPHRANDIKFISNIEGYHGNIYKLGRLLRHDWFTVTYRDGKNKERYLFLFKARILVCKVRRISEDRSVFVLKDIIRLPEVEVKDLPDNSRAFQLRHQDGEVRPYPLTISAHNDSAKDAWLKEIRLYAADSLALAEHAADDLHLKEDEAVSSSVTEPQQPPRHKVIIHKVQVEEAPPTPEPLIEEPVTPAPDASALKRKDEPLAELDDSKKARVVEEVFEDALEHLPEEDNVQEEEVKQEEVKQEEVKQEEVKQESSQDAVQNGDDMSEYVSRRSSVRRAGSSRTDVEESYSVSRSSRHEMRSETSI
ncbi:obscurin-like, partial [Frankliniella occidentalis]|uniref:Obscurin-like n=1 Tax=Frankliniella occidentalis TaxID=133901 RepID=A0A9C6XTG1_FRAOC